MMKTKLFDRSKPSFAKLATGTVVLLVGIVIGVIAAFLISVRNLPVPEELEAIVLQNSVKYIVSEQKRLQTECNELNSMIRFFVNQDLRPVLNSYQSGENWYKRMTPDVRKRIEKLRYDYSSCGRLYSEAQRVKWKGLNQFGYTIALETELIVLNTLIRFEFCDVHDAKCMDQGLSDLKDAVSKIETRLASTDEKESKGPAISRPKQ